MTDKEKEKLVFDILFSDIEDFEVELGLIINDERVNFRLFIKDVIKRSSNILVKDTVTTITSGPLWKFSIKR